ncbi:MAG: sensor domain-containing protein, partial [Mycobacterium sp.]
MMVGTLAYMAPERFTAGTADARSDVYALACVLCECLTGATPYPGESMEQQIAGHLTLDPPKPSEQRPDVPAGFDEVIAAGMAKKPDERYQSARELATAARHALTEVSDPAGDPHTPVTLLDDPTRPAPAPAGEESVEPTQPAIQQRPPGWPRGDRNRWLGLGVAALVVVATLAGAGIYFGTKKSNKGAATTSTTTAPTTTIPAGPPPVAEGALDGLLLSPAEINTTMGGTEMTVYRPWNTLNDVGFKNPTSPPECNPLSGAAEDLAYAGSGWTAVRGQTLQEPQHFTHFVDQGVVLFPSAQAAAAFVSASTQSWPACANRSYTGNVYNARWSAGPVSTTNGTLSATSSMANGWACQRALTARNNVVIDVTGCSFNTTEQGVSLADQIAAKVPTT